MDNLQLVEDHLRLAYLLAARCRRRSRLAARLSPDDCAQASVLGLLLAARRFDPARGVRFSTYALYFCQRAIWDEVRRSAGVVVLPQPTSANQRSRFRSETLRQMDRASVRLADGGTAVRLIALAYSASGVDAVDAADWALDALSKLDPRERDVIEAIVLRGERPRDVALRLGISRESVRLIRVRAMGKLRRNAHG